MICNCDRKQNGNRLVCLKLFSGHNSDYNQILADLTPRVAKERGMPAKKVACRERTWHAAKKRGMPQTHGFELRLNCATKFRKGESFIFSVVLCSTCVCVMAASFPSRAQGLHPSALITGCSDGRSYS
jgi:hypothetical protein